MERPTIGSALVAAGLIATVAVPRSGPTGSPVSATVADTTDALTAPCMERVTMDPIRVTVPRDAQYEAVTMDPIRVVVPRAESAAPDDHEAIPRREAARTSRRVSLRP